VICECCEEPVLDLVEMEAILVVETESRAPAAMRAAPRRPARWCHGCAGAHERWKARQRRPVAVRTKAGPAVQLELPGWKAAPC
jgi:hypothetical protein